MARLTVELELRGISSFVAHEDITPSLEWQNELELALRSMHALAALLTAEFHASKWPDQQTGFALGKGVLVVPLRLGTGPYGFIGKATGAVARVCAAIGETEPNQLAAEDDVPF